MLETISAFFSIIVSILLIIYFIVILIALFEYLYPNYTWSDFFNGKSDKNNKNDHKPDFEEDATDNIEESEPESRMNDQTEYKKYNQNFKLEPIKGPLINEIKGDQITAKDLKSLIYNNDFMEDYLSSVIISMEDQLVYYTQLKKKVENDLLLNQNSNKSNIIGTHDSNVDLMEIEKKEYDDIILSINNNIKELNVEKIKKNFRQILYNKKFGFASITGRDDVKDFLVKQIYTFSRNPKVFCNNFQGIRFYGNPGIGKSKLAESLGYIYSKSYILPRRKYRDTTSKNFTSQYVNESRRLAYKVLLGGLGGVIFIDEAYGLCDNKSFIQDHGNESITEMVKFLDKYQGKSIVIIAGYETQMEAMLRSNDGFKDRFPYLFNLSDYNSTQLTEILIKFIKMQDETLVIDNKDSNCIYTYIDYLYNTSKDVFSSQARSMKYLAQDILNNIYNSKNHQWVIGDKYLTTRAYLLLGGFNSYLKKYGITITL